MALYHFNHLVNQPATPVPLLGKWCREFKRSLSLVFMSARCYKIITFTTWGYQDTIWGCKSHFQVVDFNQTSDGTLI